MFTINDIASAKGITRQAAQSRLNSRNMQPKRVKAVRGGKRGYYSLRQVMDALTSPDQASEDKILVDGHTLPLSQAKDHIRGLILQLENQAAAGDVVPKYIIARVVYQYRESLTQTICNLIDTLERNGKISDREPFYHDIDNFLSDISFWMNAFIDTQLMHTLAEVCPDDIDRMVGFLNIGVEDMRKVFGQGDHEVLKAWAEGAG